jgi:hypothetical protein
MDEKEPTLQGARVATRGITYPRRLRMVVYDDKRSNLLAGSFDILYISKHISTREDMWKLTVTYRGYGRGG